MSLKRRKVGKCRKMIIRIANAVLTGLLTIYVGCRQLKYGGARAGVMGTGFFAVAFYLDNIFSLIMGSAVSAARMRPGAALPGWGMPEAGLGPEFVLQLAGFLISKSILGIFLMTASAVGQEAFLAWGTGNEASGSPAGGCQEECAELKEKRENRRKRKRRRLQYMEGLTIGISLFFVILGLNELDRSNYFLTQYRYPTDVTVPDSGSMARENFTAVLSGQGSAAVDGADFLLALRLLFLLTLLLAYYVSLCFFRKKQYARERRQESRFRRQEAALYLKNVEDQYQRTRELWHDLKNHISYLSLLLQEEKYAEMSDYLRIFADDVDSLALPVKSGNPVVDALLADKSAKAKKEGIPVELSLCDLTGLSLKQDELCGLLGNLLDNALEANRQVEEGRFLAVESRRQGEWYYIKVQNAVRAGGPRSLKTDRRNRVGHGLGLRSAERIVHGCGGELAVEFSERRFTAVVRLPGQP